MFDRKIPYNELPILPLKADLETKSILLKIISASRTLAQLNGAIRNLPNPTLFLDTIQLQEARASSAIENIITTNDDLYKALIANDCRSNSQFSSKDTFDFGEIISVYLFLARLIPCSHFIFCHMLNHSIFHFRVIGLNQPMTSLQCQKSVISFHVFMVVFSCSNTYGQIIFTPNK